MFEAQKKIGQFKVFGGHYDSLHHRNPRVERRAAFFAAFRIEHKQAYHSYGNLPVGEVYRRALAKCPSISVDARRQQGVPCITGTRIPVHLVLWAVEQTGSIDGALKSYPDLNARQVKDALYFAETILGSPNVITEATLTT